MSDKRKTYSNARQVRARYGNVSDMTLWRWLADPVLGFPRPLVIRRRRLFDDQELAEFDSRKKADA